MMKKEMKFALPTGLGIVAGIFSGAFILCILVGTIFGLVWGYGDHLLEGGAPKTKARKAAKKSTRKTSKKRRK